MSDDDSFHTFFLNDCLTRLKQGDREARNELIRVTHSRLERLAERMIRKFPKVSRWAEAVDVYQGGAMRILRAVETTWPANTREFMNLSAALMRRELIDLARHFGGPQGIDANHASHAPGDSVLPHIEAADYDADPVVMERWALLHQVIEQMPVELRETFGLIFYHAWTQKQIAELFGVHVRTVRRWWQEALEYLRTKFGELPGSGGDGK